MSSEWLDTVLGEICKFTAGSAFKPEHQGQKDGKYPFIKVSDMNLTGNEIFIQSAQNYVSSELKNAMGAKEHPAGATVFAKIGVALQSNRRRLLVRPTIIDNNMMSATPKAEKVTARFLYFLLSSLDFNSISAGTALPYLNVSDLQKFPVSIPRSIEIQQEVERVLGALDNRITLLRETNATLEAIAQALFKSWFVDFDPVRAKMEGRAPEGMDEATAALFPDGFEESELGAVPRGWKISSVEDFSEKIGMGPFGSNIKVETFVESGIPVISGQHLKQMMVEDNTFNFITHEHAKRLAKSCVQHGDVIFTHAGSIGQVSLLHKGSEYSTYVLSQRQFFLRCNPDLMTPEWITHFFKSHAGQHLLLANTSQVGVPSIARPVTYLRSIRLVTPPQTLNRKFASVCEAMNDSLMANRKQIGTLVTLRDTLLPRLISGQLRLPEAQALMEEAV